MTTALALPLLHAALAADPVRLAPLERDGVSLYVPEGWSALVQPEQRSVVLSQGLYTTVRLQWFPLPPGVRADQAIDILEETVAESLPIGALGPSQRTPVPAVDGILARQRYTLLGYGFDLAYLAWPHRDLERIVTAVLVTSADHFETLDGEGLLRDITATVRLADDPPWPVPAWWFDDTPPPALAWPPRAAP